MILGVALGRPTPVAVVVRDGALVAIVASGAHRARAGARAACVAVDLAETPMAPVAAIRVAGRCPAVLGPMAGRPEVPGVATIVCGGHRLTGRELAPLDTEAVRRFVAGCGLADFAVTAAGSPAVPDHELAVAEIIAAEMPGARITLSYESGRPGLREREEDTVRSAALRPQAARIADETARELPGLPIYFARTAGGLVSATYFCRAPLVCRLGGTASAARGRAALSGDLSPGAGPPEGTLRDGGPPGWEHAGSGPERAAYLDAVAAAYGATLTGPVAEVERIVRARGGEELDRRLREIRDEALTRVVSAGAAPGSATVTASAVNPLSFLPDGLYWARITATGATP
ncbi:hypothetical protein [Nonomuraea sp. NPDC048916]|uniref:hypothetical protein n=1 Tax=Nonomuraea sp. NPDC048916 TaxID=3154232 RepID=UPI0033F6D3EF